MVAATPRAGLGILALIWATAAVAGIAGTAGYATATRGATVEAAVTPSVQILPNQSNLAGTCGGAAFSVNTFIHVGTQGSADVQLSAPGVGLLEEFTDHTGHIGPYNAVFPDFGVLGFGGGLAPNTPLTLIITSYSGNDLSGTITYVSTLVFSCTTGAIINRIAVNPAAANSPPALSIPTLSDVGIIAAAFLLALIAMISLRQREAARRTRPRESATERERIEY